jgi:hypothetical protein
MEVEASKKEDDEQKPYYYKPNSKNNFNIKSLKEITEN